MSENHFLTCIDENCEKVACVYRRDMEFKHEQVKAREAALRVEVAVLIKNRNYLKETLEARIKELEAFNDAEHYKRYKGSIDQRMRFANRVDELEACLEKIANQTTPEEYEDREGEEPDAENLAEAYEFVVLEAREALGGKN